MSKDDNADGYNIDESGFANAEDIFTDLEEDDYEPLQRRNNAISYNEPRSLHL